MDALKIAMETIIVGSLGLPWMFLLVDLFCPEREQLIGCLLKRLADKATATATGVLLFALAYLVGASVARVAGDFFNDDDLHLHITEDLIRSEVYCRPNDPWLLQRGTALTDEAGHVMDSGRMCPKDDPGSWINNARQTFAVQEGSLLLTGSEGPDRIRYLHQQLVVLRGVSFDGLVITALCLFGALAKHRWLGRGGLILVSVGILVWSIKAMHRHLGEHQSVTGEPPLLEIILIALAVAGLCLVLKDVPNRPYECSCMFSAVLTGLALSGWWYSEILYGRTVIYFFYAHTHTAVHLSP
jgi:hypothetical protein